MNKTKNKFRIESDSMGKVKIPKNAMYGPQTQNYHNLIEIDS